MQNCIKTDQNSSQTAVVGCEIIKPSDQKNGSRKKNHKVTKQSHYQHVESDDFAGEEASGLIHPSFPTAKYDSLSTKTRIEVMITNEKHSGVCPEYIDLECDFEKHSRWSVTPSMALSSNDLKLTIVKETPDMNARNLVKTPESFSKDEYSNPRTEHLSTVQPLSFLNSNAGPVKTMCSALVSPERGIATKANTTEPEAESSWSVNSHALKRRKFTGLSSSGPLQAINNSVVPISGGFSSLGSSVITSDANRSADEINHSENNFDRMKSFLSSALNISDGSHMASDLNMDQRLQIFCSSCRNPLGNPEKDLHVTCSLISSSKVHLMSLWKKSWEAVASSTSSVDIVVSDMSSVDQRLCKTAQEGASGQGIWCKEDGCVFNSIFCPFCIDPSNCLGVQVAATDASNIKFQNKILFYIDHLETKKFEATMEKVLFSPDNSIMVKNRSPIAIEKFAYISPTQDSRGWRNTKSQMRSE